MIEERELTMEGRQETPRERLDRNLSELTGELRVVVTGAAMAAPFALLWFAAPLRRARRSRDRSRPGLAR